MTLRYLLSGFLILCLAWYLPSPKRRVGPLPVADFPVLVPASTVFLLNNAFSEGLAFAPLNAQMEILCQQWHLRGAVLAISKNGRMVYCRGFGEADEGIATQPYHQFRIASISKLFTATAIMHLARQGKLRLEDRVFGPKGILNEAHYQEIADSQALKIELQHLLRHTAGWRNQLRTDPMFAPLEVAQIMQVPPPPSMETIIRFMLGQKGILSREQCMTIQILAIACWEKLLKKSAACLMNNICKAKYYNPWAFGE
ncbi:MAG: beta-lactamase family protein [Microscillaceae bacterium]|nr:beta-lactamase family protein [Microscillaceae bacterium]